MADNVFLILFVTSPYFCLAADGNISDPSISIGGVIAIVLLVVFSIVLLVTCIYQSKRLNNANEPERRVLRCGGCRRGFRVPESVADAEFMCSRCVTEGRRRMSQVLEEERLARFARMKESANTTVKLQRVTSTYFKFARKSQSNVASLTSSKVVSDSANTSVAGGGGNDCKICFDDESCIVLLPCCHSGLCEGCAKDMVYMTKECYICRQEVELIAKVKVSACDEPPPALSACLVAPESLHHLSSRCNTQDNSEEQTTSHHPMPSTIREEGPPTNSLETV